MVVAQGKRKIAWFYRGTGRRPAPAWGQDLPFKTASVMVATGPWRLPRLVSSQQTGNMHPARGAIIVAKLWSLKSVLADFLFARHPKCDKTHLLAIGGAMGGG